MRFNGHPHWILFVDPIALQGSSAHGPRGENRYQIRVALVYHEPRFEQMIMFCLRLHKPSTELMHRDLACGE